MESFMVGRKRSTLAFGVALAAIVMAAGCRDEATTGPSKIPSRDYASNLVLLAGDVQTGPVALPLPTTLTVKVVDAGGRSVQGASVVWTVIGGGGEVNPPTGVSDANGIVTTSWTLGTALGENKVRAYLSNGYLLDSVTFTATAVNGAGVTIKVNAGSQPPAAPAVASTLLPVSFTILDEFGHPVPGAQVNFTTGANSGSVNPAVGITNEAGVVSTIWTTGTQAGQQSLSATLPGQLPITLFVNAVADTSRRINLVSGDGQVAPVAATLALPLTVTITDKFGNPIAGEVVIFNDSLGGGATVTPTSAVTDASGSATATWRPGAMAGIQRIRVRAANGGQVVRFTATSQVQFRDVFAGDYYVCGVSTSDRAYCWGFGEDGQLGTFSLTSRNAPNWPVVLSGGDTLAGPYPTFREISGGKAHACGIAVSRTLLCWGYNPDRRQFIEPNGQNPKATNVAPGGNPALNPGLASTLMVGTGESFSCAVTLGGLAMCAGNNELGQLGIGVRGGFLATALVDTTAPQPTRYAAIAVGERHACGMPRFDPAVAASRVPWCWGQNNSGQLGLGTFADSTLPSQVVMTNVIGGVFETTSLVAGAAHSCALSPVGLTGGTAYCWGSNVFGQLATGTATGPTGRDSIPQPVGGGMLFARLYAGTNHTCGLTVTGAAFCWGKNSSGQLGNGSISPFSAVPTAVAGGLSFSNLALGENHTCGITGTGPQPTGTTGVAGTIYCWGDNEYGQLGLGMFGANATPLSTPQRVVFQP
jgi:alpha-tubulin suppressor-like RCC1 family protein